MDVLYRDIDGLGPGGAALDAANVCNSPRYQANNADHPYTV